jgi:biotin synthase
MARVPWLVAGQICASQCGIPSRSALKCTRLSPRGGQSLVSSLPDTEWGRSNAESSLLGRMRLPENLTNVSATKPVLRHAWTREEIRQIYRQPLPDLLFSAQQLHRQFHDPNRVQFCRLLSIKTGGCPEDCAYCPQSAHYATDVARGGLLPIDEVTEFAERARGEGATRFCMGAAWRQVEEGEDFETVLEMVRRVAQLGLEVCCSLGMLDDTQAERLAGAGLTAYNHNLDTSPEFYGQIITTRNYSDRLETLAAVRKAGITVCCGGIVGLGESDEDRVGLLHQLSTLNPHPESVPINALVSVAGTPLGQQAPLDPLVYVRTIATARILMPASMVRLSAGRRSLSREAVALCFVAGANSLFIGEKLLTTPNPEPEDDAAMLESLGLERLPLP